MTSNVIDFPRVLPIAARPIFVRLIDQDLDSTASSTAFFARFFLCQKKQKYICQCVYIKKYIYM